MIKIKNTPNTIHLFTGITLENNPGLAGISAYLLYNDRKKILYDYLDHTTNNYARLSAIKKGLECINNNYKHIPVIIYTDNEYCSKSLTRGDWKAKKNKQIILDIKDLINSFNKVDFRRADEHGVRKYSNEAYLIAVKAFRNLKPPSIIGTLA